MVRSFVQENTVTVADHEQTYSTLLEFMLYQDFLCFGKQTASTLVFLDASTINTVAQTRVEQQVNKLHLLNSEHKRWRKTGLDMTAGRRLFTAVGGEALT